MVHPPTPVAIGNPPLALAMGHLQCQWAILPIHGNGPTPMAMGCHSNPMARVHHPHPMAMVQNATTSSWSTSFYTQVPRQKAPSDPLMSMELLHDFVDHMGFKDKDFRDISADALKTTHAGTMQIYDYMRKRIGKLDEKPMRWAPH